MLTKHMRKMSNMSSTVLNHKLKRYGHIFELIGNTPMVRINRMNPNPRVEICEVGRVQPDGFSQGQNRFADDREGRKRGQSDQRQARALRLHEISL